MIRLLGTPGGAVLLSKLRGEAQTTWPKLLGCNEINNGAQIGFYFEDADAPPQSAVNVLMAVHVATPLPPTPEQTQIASDKAQIIAFFNAASGTATSVQLDDTIKAIIRYLRRSGNDA